MHISDQRFRIFNQLLSPLRAFWIFAFLHLLIWTLLPVLVCPNAPLDVIEGYGWGREWLAGTYKHPQMQAWVLESLAWLTGRSAIGHFLASQLAIVTAFWAVWRTGLRILGPIPALVGALLLEGIIYYNFTSTEFNPNVLQIPFWALIGLYYYRAIRDDTLSDWLLLGLWSAGGLYTKYSTVLLLAALAILTLARPESRRRLSRPGPYIALLTALILFMPHLQWLIEHHFFPFSYARDRLQPLPVNDVIHSPIMALLIFIGCQFLSVLPCILIFLGLFTQSMTRQPRLFSNFDKAFLWTITFGPCFLVLVMAAIFGLNVHTMWATPFWNFFGVWLLAYFQPSLSSRTLRRFAVSGSLLVAATLCIYTGGTFFYPYLANRGLRIDFPGRQLAKIVDTAWTSRYHTPLAYAIGDTWVAGNVAYYTPERPHLYIDANQDISTWIDAAEVDRQGGVILWCVKHCSFANRGGDTPAYMAHFPRAEIQPPLEIKRQTGADIAPVSIGWAILPPR